MMIINCVILHIYRYSHVQILSLLSEVTEGGSYLVNKMLGSLIWYHKRIPIYLPVGPPLHCGLVLCELFIRCEKHLFNQCVNDVWEILSGLAFSVTLPISPAFRFVFEQKIKVGRKSRCETLNECVHALCDSHRSCHYVLQLHCYPVTAKCSKRMDGEVVIE